MAQVERNDKALTYTGSGTISTVITTLRTNIQAGKLIRAADMDSLGALINNMLGHYHTYDDAYQLATYGNNGNRNNYYEDKNTDPLGGSVSASHSGTITIASYNEKAQKIRALQSHSHTINDRTA